MSENGLKIIEDATCTFCGCVCDDIQLQVEDESIRTRRLDSAYYRRSVEIDVV